MVGKAIDGVFVFDQIAQRHSVNRDGDRVDAVAVVVGHGVVRVVGAPATPRTSHKDVREPGRGARHVDVERRLGGKPGGCHKEHREK